MDINEFLTHFQKAERCGSGWHALCPAHEDKKQSLSISEADGKILLHCHAGCAAEEIVHTAGLRLSDLFTDRAKPMKSEKAVKVAEYIYRDMNGNAVFKKIRRSDKSFYWLHSEGSKWEKGTGSKTVPLYHSFECRKYKYLYLVEGEKDTDNMMLHELPAVSPPNGAGRGENKWRQEYTEFFKGKRVCIIQDNDDIGKSFAAQVASKLIGTAEIVKVLDLSKIWAEIPEKGDISDMMINLSDWKERLQRLAKEEKEFELPVESVKHDDRQNDLAEQILRAAREPDTAKRAESFTDIMTAARTQGLEQQALQLAEGICRKENLPELWELPRPFDGGAALPKLTERCLPPKLWEYLKAVSEYVQVAPEMAVFPLLSVLSTCVQGKAVITYPKNDHTEPLNIYAMTIAAPGERKSGCFKEFVTPLHEYQYTYNLSHKFDIQKYITEKEFLKRQKENSMKGQKADRKKALEITKQLSELEEVHELKIIVEDTTPEALAAELAKQGERVAILDDEGSVFDVISGAYSNTQVNINIFLKGYDGAPYTVTRKMSPDITLLNPLLVMGLMVQPSHFTEAMCNKQFSGRGFIHRFMFAFPEPMSGRLKFESPNIPPNLRTVYSDIVKSLLNIAYPKDKSPVIRHSHESELLFGNYFDHLQFEMKQGGQFENMKEWASKQFARALRLAGIFHVVENYKCTEPATESDLSGQAAQYAIDFSLWQEKQAYYALSGEGAESETVQNAKLILDKLRKLEVKAITKGELLSNVVRGFKASDLLEPLELLEDLNYIKITEEKPKGAGKPKQIIHVSPLA